MLLPFVIIHLKAEENNKTKRISLDKEIPVLRIIILLYFLPNDTLLSKEMTGNKLHERYKFGFQTKVILPDSHLKPDFGLGVLSEIKLTDKMFLHPGLSMSFFQFKNRMEYTLFEANLIGVIKPNIKNINPLFIFGTSYKVDIQSRNNNGLFINFGAGYEIALPYFQIIPQIIYSSGNLFNFTGIMITFKG